MAPPHSVDSPLLNGATLAVLQCNRIDCEGLVALLKSRPELDVVGGATSLTRFLTICGRRTPDVAIVDAQYPTLDSDIVTIATDFLKEGKVRRLLFLDSVPNLKRAQRVAEHTSMGYVVRGRTFGQLVAAVADMLGEQPPNDGLACTDNDDGYAKLTTQALRRLTPRELEVFQRIAEGQSVQQCAKALNLAAKTIDNHKSRLMKKLGVTKTVQLTRLAIRAGVISP